MAQKRSSKAAALSKRPSKSTKSTKVADTRMTMCTVPNLVSTPIRERRPDRSGRVVAGKRLAMTRPLTGKARATRRSLDPCDNSNDSGLGFDQHADRQAGLGERVPWTDRVPIKRPRYDGGRDVKLEMDELNDNFGFPEPIRSCKDTVSIIRTAPSATAPSLSMSSNHTTTSSARAVPRCTPLVSRGSTGGAVTLTSQLPTSSRDCDISLRIVSQPEQQHRARYQTEGSRGAVKDRSGNGFPVVQLIGYHKPATLQVFIGTDVGKVTPHMFYQACRVSGKNSTPCMEKKMDGTVVIELQLDPSKDMIGTCDCVGILKERNVDVEHRFPEQIGSRSKKKSTRCRMVFRTTIAHENGVQETLQVCSQPIVCTQPPGIPEICKKSLTSCPATGGLELFILGKNFLKDTRVFFQQIDEQGLRWEQSVTPDKEFLQQTHLVCVVPPYVRPDITEPITVRLLVVSSGKTSEPHQFVYTPTSGAISSVRADSVPAGPFRNNNNSNSSAIWPSVSKHEQGMMPPPGTSLMPVTQPRRASIGLATVGGGTPSPPLHQLKQELLDESSQSSLMDATELRREQRFRHLSESSMDVQHGDSNLTMLNDNSIDMMRRNSIGLENVALHDTNGGIESMRRNSLGRESAMDVVGPMQTALTTLVAPSLTHCDKLLIGQGLIAAAHLQPPPQPMEMRGDDLKVMDLRMKMAAPTVGGVVSDLVHTHAPSLATLHCFGVTEASNIPLPTQTAQSVENYFTTIETKPVATIDDSLNTKISQMMSEAQHGALMSTHMRNNGDTYAQTMRVGLCREANLISTNVARTQTAVENELMAKSLNAGKMESLLPKDMLLGSKSPLLPQTTALAPPQLLIPATINTALAAPILEQAAATTLSPDVILNAQIAPSMMCRNGPDNTLLTNIAPPLVAAADANLMQQVAVVASAQAQAPLGADPEKAILLEAAVDLFETQKKISELDQQLSPKTATTTIDQAMLGGMLATSSASLAAAESNVSGGFATTTAAVMSAKAMDSAAQAQKGEYAPVVPVAVKEMDVRMGEKKNEDRMIPTGFATMSENELINIINPSCFDQV